VIGVVFTIKYMIGQLCIAFATVTPQARTKSCMFTNNECGQRGL